MSQRSPHCKPENCPAPAARRILELADISRLLTAIRHAPGRRDDANLWSPPRHDGPDALFHCGVVTQGSEAPRRWGPGPRSSPEAEA
jgi:hypothetical protein